MKNTYKLFWSDEALSNLSLILEYLENRWTKKEIQKFAKLLESKINHIQSNPLIYPATESSSQIRKCVLSKQTTIYYKIIKFEIQIITLFDNRQDPAKGK